MLCGREAHHGQSPAFVRLWTLWSRLDCWSAICRLFSCWSSICRLFSWCQNIACNSKLMFNLSYCSALEQHCLNSWQVCQHLCDSWQMTFCSLSCKGPLTGLAFTFSSHCSLLNHQLGCPWGGLVLFPQIVGLKCLNLCHCSPLQGCMQSAGWLGPNC